MSKGKQAAATLGKLIERNTYPSRTFPEHKSPIGGEIRPPRHVSRKSIPSLHAKCYNDPDSHTAKRLG